MRLWRDFHVPFRQSEETGMNDSREDSERPQQPHLFTETMSSRNWGRRLMTPSITTVHSGSMRRFHALHRNTRAEVAHNEDKLGDILSNTEHMRTVQMKTKNNNTYPKKTDLSLDTPRDCQPGVLPMEVERDAREMSTARSRSRGKPRGHTRFQFLCLWKSAVFQGGHFNLSVCLIFPVVGRASCA